MRERKVILTELEHLDGSRQGADRVMRALLEVALDLRDMLGAELYTRPSEPKRPDPIPYERDPRLPTGPPKGGRP